MRIAVFGGSFDPPHVGHVLATQYVLSIGEAERVLVIPVYHHAHDKPLSPFAVRLRLCRAAFDFDSRIFVSDLERELPRPSYTLRTLEALRQERPQDEMRLIVGADVLLEVDKWHRFDEVKRLAPPLVLGRAGYDDAGAGPAVLPRVSSTEVRNWVRAGGAQDLEQLRLLTPRSVRELIEQEGLYR